MSAELVRGQNHRLPGNRLEIRVSAGTPVVAAVTLGDEQGRVVGEQGWLAHPGTPHLPGIEVPRQAAADHRLALDLGAMPEPVRRVHVLLALPTGRPGGPQDFGAAPAPHLAVTTLDGIPAAGFTITGLGTETALLALELYRRQGAWKVRAVGQGYAGGLPALLLDQGVPEAVTVAGEIHAAVEREQSRSVALPSQTGQTGQAGQGAQASQTGHAGQSGQAAPSGRPVPPTAGAGGGIPAPPGGDAATTAGIDYRHPRRRTAAAVPPRPGGAAQPAPAQPVPPQAPPIPAFPGQVPPAPEYEPPAPPDRGAPPVPVAGDASGWTMEERLHNQIWGMFEDLARSVAAYRSAADFAQSRYEQELDRLLADPRTRGGPAADAARDEAQLKQVALVDQARAVLDRDLAQLTAEAEVVEPALPAPFAGWENPVWHAYRVPSEPPMAVRLGGLTLPEAPELCIPLLARLPLERGLWIDSFEDRRLAVETAVAIAARLLASYPAGGFVVHTLDPAGSGAAPLAPLSSGGALVRPPAAAGAAGVSEVLTRLTERVDLLQMALRGARPTRCRPASTPPSSC